MVGHFFCLWELFFLDITDELRHGSIPFGNPSGWYHQSSEALLHPTPTGIHHSTYTPWFFSAVSTSPHKLLQWSKTPRLRSQWCLLFRNSVSWSFGILLLGYGSSVSDEKCKKRVGITFSFICPLEISAFLAVYRSCCFEISPEWCSASNRLRT